VAESAIDVLLHPVRLRIVRELAPSRDRTVSDLAAALPDVPPASLYRHVNRLAASGIIEAVSERAIRGATERSYRLARGVLGAADARASADDHLRYFITFVATAIDDFAAYLASGAPDFERDGVGYRQIPLDLTDAEFRQLARALSTALRPFVGRPPSPKRKPRLLSTIVMPDVRRRD